jgi:hypothetical protein
MAQKTLREFYAPTTANIHTRPEVNVGDNGFELNPAVITMVQANQFCGKAHEDASAHLQLFLEICNMFTIKGVPRDAILLCLSHFHYWRKLSSGSMQIERNTLHGISAQLLS